MISGERPTRRDPPVVTILLRNLNQYRHAFYDLLRTELEAEGIHLRLVTASGMLEDAAKGDHAQLAWAEQRQFREISIRGESLLWQSGFDLARSSDLIVTEQATKQLFNVVLAYGQRMLGTRHVFWGHGRNFQASIEGGSGEALKRRLTQRAHWFFSYNDLSSQAAIESGMPADRITPLMNSTDTLAMRNVIAGLNTEQVRAEFGFGDGPLGLFMAGLTPYKRPDFLIEAAIEVRRQLVDFELVVIGDGSLREVVAQASEEHSWIHWLGAMYDDDRLGPASMCSVQLMPGLVGLNIVDGFALSIPTVTIEADGHGPEIDYLENGVNGAILPIGSTPAEYATHVVELLSDEPALQDMRAEAERWGQRLSIQDMAQRFVAGTKAALAAEPRR